MKYFLIIMSAFMWAVIVSSLMLSGVRAESSTWTSADSKRELASGALMFVDMMQTMDIKNHDDIEEANPLARSLLGSNPEPLQTGAYFAAAAGIHYGISRALPRGWREAWQYGTIVVQGSVVANNWAIGLRMKW